MKLCFLKKYYPIYEAGNLLCIGIPGTEKLIEVKNNQRFKSLVEQLIRNGITGKDIKDTTIFKRLYEKEMLDHFESDEKTNRSDLFLNYLEIPYTKKDVESKHILIFGAGAGGSTIAYLLAQFGFSNITIIDDDLVEESDVRKTLIFRKSDIGKPKVFVLKEIILNNFEIRINVLNESPNSESELHDIISHYEPNFIIKACDPDLSFRYYLNKICFKENIPFIYMAYAYEILKIGPLFVPGLTESDNTIERNIVKKLGKNYSFLKHKKLYTDYSIHPSISFNINVLANLILKEILFFFLNKKDYCLSLNQELLFIPLTMKTYYKNISS